ncbi:P-loop containing nucleoside triphosphate hydrolase protein [Hypoxylon fragiforme]|uniref:P-loop containing nucleoside triphosphate hydrolase protein n=1 Tax=Hypoxylon fragiforme TaxID=63214 RepID=UPI0020C68C61|nr:P-loop containing nucleoside triphosphate hydrolase protein [Hypoxylon fragiforme]KAI2611712.1 P-loop containing nucleoside triphosphate hydrolase protein [Hypoxylon fragiforme]
MWLLTHLHNLLVTLGILPRRAKLLVLGLDNAGKTTLIRRLASSEHRDLTSASFAAAATAAAAPTTTGLAPTTPTAQASTHTLRVGNVQCLTTDVSGARPARQHWASYYTSAPALSPSPSSPPSPPSPPSYSNSPFIPRQPTTTTTTTITTTPTPSVNGLIFLIDATDRSRFREVKRELDVLLAAPQLRRVPILLLGNKVDDRGAVCADELRWRLGLNRVFRRPVALAMCSVVGRSGYADGLGWLLGNLR